jgi:5'-nucleotidase
MNKTRRLFLSHLTVLSGTACLSAPLSSAAAVTNYVDELLPSAKKASIYHTNDLQGNLAGLKQIKAVFENDSLNGLLLDAGGFIDSSKSISEQRRIVYTMNAMGYKAAGLSNYELASGHENLVSLASTMQFSLVNCNHSFEGELNWIVKPYIIFKYNNIKIGITGVSSPLKGAKYNDAIQSANKTAAILKNNKKCDLVICLSHLSHAGEESQALATQSENIDMIIGSDNGKLYPNTLILRNKIKHEVILAQTASNGLMAGNTIINFNRDKQKSAVLPKSFVPGDENMYQVAFEKVRTSRLKTKPA